MIKGRTIVCLASAWDYDPTSKHQIMKILAQHNDIIWVNYHGTRRPTLSKSDLRASWSALMRFARGIQRVGPSFVQVTPLVIPGASNPVLRKLHERMLITQIRRTIQAVSGAANKPVQVWSFAPDVPYLIGQFNEEAFIYYCVDDYTEFEGLDTDRITLVEDDLRSRSDIVVATSELLLKKNRKSRPDTVLVRHGVDFDHFASAWRDKLDRPDDLKNIEGPIFGFFGLIHFWIDLRLIAEVARLRPQYSFVMIGDCIADTRDLERLPNVHLLGRRPNKELPAYCAAFDAGLMPFACNAMTRSINPIKMYEYLASGLPVIATPLPEAERFTGPIKISETPERFASACDNVLEEDQPGRRAVIAQTVAGESWESKVELLSEVIEARLNPATPIVSRHVTQVMPSTKRRAADRRAGSF